MINTNQNGRSMIEMLGVLAIIGVLSVGGIAGYSKAMEKMKINKTIQEISHISQNIRTLYFNQKSYDGLSYFEETADLLRSTGTVPEYMFGDEIISNDDGFSTKMYNAFGGGVYIIDDAVHNVGEYKAFDLIYTGIPKNICVELATKDWSYLDGLNAFLVQKYESIDRFPMYADCDDVETYDEWEDDEETYGILACKSLLPIPVSKTVKACDCEDNNCALWWVFE